MAISIDEVRAVLYAEEPDYNAAPHRVGVDGHVHRVEIARDADLGLAAKAVYLASLLRAPQSLGILNEAARSCAPVLRVAAAIASRNFDADATAPTVMQLLRDADVGVRKSALKAVSTRAQRGVLQTVCAMAEGEAHPDLRSLSADVLRERAK